MDIQEIQERLTRIARGETIEETVVVEGTGQGFSEARVVQKKVTPKDQVKALELLGKANGMFIEKHQVEVNEGLIVAKEFLEGAKNGKFKKS
jgi:phage terminase small subunit